MKNPCSCPKRIVREEVRLLVDPEKDTMHFKIDGELVRCPRSGCEDHKWVEQYCTWLDLDTEPPTRHVQRKQGVPQLRILTGKKVEIVWNNRDPDDGAVLPTPAFMDAPIIEPIRDQS